MLGERAGGTAQHVDLEPLDVDLHPGRPPVPDQRVDGDQFRHHRPVRRQAVPGVKSRGEPSGAAVISGRRAHRGHRVAVERDVLLEQAEGVRGGLERR